MEPVTPANAPVPYAHEPFPLISSQRFLLFDVLSLGLYGKWWQYKAWRFFKHWQQDDSWPAARAILSFFTFNSLLQHINSFAYTTHERTPIPNTSLLTAGYIVLNLMGRLPSPLWLIALGAVGFEVPAYRAFREAMLLAPAYGGTDQRGISGRQWALMAVGALFWLLLLAGLFMPEEAATALAAVGGAARA